MLPKLGSGKRFAHLTHQLAGKGARDPKALAAWIGRKKYGAEKMAHLAHHADGGMTCRYADGGEVMHHHMHVTEPGMTIEHHHHYEKGGMVAHHHHHHMHGDMPAPMDGAMHHYADGETVTHHMHEAKAEHHHHHYTGGGTVMHVHHMPDGSMHREEHKPDGSVGHYADGGEVAPGDMEPHNGGLNAITPTSPMSEITPSHMRRGLMPMHGRMVRHMRIGA